jgi:nitrate/nitrite transport system permease protein
MSTSGLLVESEPLDAAPAAGSMAALDAVHPDLLRIDADAPVGLGFEEFEAPVPKEPSRFRRLLASAFWATVGLSFVGVVWALVSQRVPELPSPAVTARTFGRLVRNPFYDNGPNDKGIGLQFASSLQRVGFGFGLAALLGVPFGMFIGTNKWAWKAANPVIQLLRPVSPLAWFPIWLFVLRDSPQAAKFVILITAFWPIVLNSSAAVGNVPPDQRNVSQVFQFNRRTYFRHVLLPNSMPGIVTGLRQSMGVAWMVIVAVEMMSVGSGVGSFVWEAYNAGDLSKVISAIVGIGFVGLILDAGFLRLSRKFSLERVVS